LGWYGKAHIHCVSQCQASTYLLVLLAVCTINGAGCIIAHTYPLHTTQILKERVSNASLLSLTCRTGAQSWPGWLRRTADLLEALQAAGMAFTWRRGGCWGPQTPAAWRQCSSR
jgi:hypothetical protein